MQFAVCRPASFMLAVRSTSISDGFVIGYSGGGVSTRTGIFKPLGIDMGRRTLRFRCLKSCIATLRLKWSKFGSARRIVQTETPVSTSTRLQDRPEPFTLGIGRDSLILRA